MSEIHPGRRAGRDLRAAEKALEAVEGMKTTVEEMTTTVEELGDTFDELMLKIFSSQRYTTESERINLLDIPYKYIKEFVYIEDYNYDRGEAVRTGWNKWVAPDGGTLNQNETPETSPRFLLHRDSASFDPDGTKRHYVGEEMCLLGTWRWDEESGNSAQHGWYMVKTRLVASKTPPYNDGANWEYKGTTNPER